MSTRGAGYPREVKALVRLEVVGMVADTAPLSGKGVRYGAFGGGGVTALVVPTVLPPPVAPDLAIDPDVRPAPFTTPPTPSPALILMSLTPLPPTPIVSP